MNNQQQVLLLSRRTQKSVDHLMKQIALMKPYYEIGVAVVEYARHEDMMSRANVTKPDSPTVDCAKANRVMELVEDLLAKPNKRNTNATERLGTTRRTKSVV